MRPQLKRKLKDHADALGVTPEVLCVRLAKKLGFQRRIIVRSETGDLRVVAPGEKLKLKHGEFIAHVPLRMISEALREIDRKGEIKEIDLDD